MRNLKVFENSTRRKALKILGVSLVGTLGYALYNFDKKIIKKSYWTGSVLNAPAKIEIHSTDKRLNNYIIKKIDELVFSYENIFNLQNKSSEINTLNSKKVLYNASPDLTEVIKNAQFISKNTDGLFDITVQPLWELYFENFIINNKKNPPDKNKIRETLKLVNWKTINVVENKISINNKISSITLNGIAQGWITDQITTLLKKNGFSNTLVDFGESYASGLYEEKRNWNILIQGRDTEKVISLSNKAIATSAGHGTIFEPTMKYHHIFNTKNGLSSNNFKTVSIISKKAWMADAISTSALSMNKESLLELSKNLNLEVIVQEKNKLIALS